MDEWFEELYEDYLASFEAWGHRYAKGPLDFDAWCDLRDEIEELDIQQECGTLTRKDSNRRDQIQRLLLEHDHYFADGPRITIVLPENEP